MKFWGWIGLAVAGAIVLAVAGYFLSSHLVEFLDVRHHVDYRVGATLPIRVAWQPEDGWKLLLVVWALVAWLAVCGWNASRAASAASMRPAPVIAGMLCIGVVLTLFPFTFSGDPYSYIIWGRLFALHGINPYLLTSPLSPLGDDLLARCLAFYGNPPPPDDHGPLWTLMAGAFARLESGASLGLQFWTFRLASLLAMAAAVGGIAHLLRKASDAERAGRIAKFALHPLVLYESAVGGHDDAFMVALFVWALAVVDEYPLVAGLLLGAAIGVKYVAVLVLPFVLVRASAHSRLAPVLAAAIAAIVVVLCFKPFWIGAPTLYALIGHGGVLAMSLTWLLSAPFFAAGIADQPAFGGAVSLPFFGQAAWPRLIQAAFVLGFLGVAAYSIVRYAVDRLSGDIWRTLTAFLWASPILHPWYLLWLSPATSSRGRWGVFAWWFCLLGMLRYVLDATGAAFAIQAVLTLALLGVPIVLALREGRLVRSGGLADIQE
jgi:hypothetical protein